MMRFLRQPLTAMLWTVFQVPFSSSYLNLKIWPLHVQVRGLCTINLYRGSVFQFIADTSANANQFPELS